MNAGNIPALICVHRFNMKLGYYKIDFSKSKLVEEVGKRKKDYAKELKGIILDGLPDYDLVMSAIDKWAR